MGRRKTSVGQEECQPWLRGGGRARTGARTAQEGHRDEIVRGRHTRRFNGKSKCLASGHTYIYGSLYPPTGPVSTRRLTHPAVCLALPHVPHIPAGAWPGCRHTTAHQHTPRGQCRRRAHPSPASAATRSGRQRTPPPCVAILSQPPPEPTGPWRRPHPTVKNGGYKQTTKLQHGFGRGDRGEVRVRTSGGGEPHEGTAESR